MAGSRPSLVDQSAVVFVLAVLTAIFACFKDELGTMLTITKFGLGGGAALWFISLVVTQELTKHLWVAVLPAAAFGGTLVGAAAFYATGIPVPGR